MMHRRQCLKAAAAGSAGLVPVTPRLAPAEPAPETSRLRLARITELCMATPQQLAEDLLRAEGFSDIEYVDTGGGPARFKAVVEDRVDMSVATGAPLIIRVDAGDPIMLLAGLHVGCFELFATERIRSVRDLKGKSVAVTGLGTGKDVPFGRLWDKGAQDTIRFYALRLREAGLIKSSPQKILAQGTDWRFLNELERELKG